MAGRRDRLETPVGAVHHRTVCEHAPCNWNAQGLPRFCPAPIKRKEEDFCEVLLSVEPAEVIESFEEIPALIRVAAPVYVKFGLKNAPDIYPSGSHIEATAVALSRERVRRARLGMELLARAEGEFSMSDLPASGLAVPVPSRGR